MKKIMLFITSFSWLFTAYSMGSDPTEVKKVNFNKAKIENEKKVLVHVLEPKLKNASLAFKKELYQIVLDEVLKTNNFSLLMNDPKELRNARIKFVEIHTEMSMVEKVDGADLYNVGVYLADGGSGRVIAQEERGGLPESRVRFFIRKTLRDLFFYDLKNKKKNDSVIALSEDIELQPDVDSEKRRKSSGLKSGSSFTPLFDPVKKGISISGKGDNREQASKYAADSYENLIPYSFRKKKNKDTEEAEQNESGISSPSGMLKFENESAFRSKKSSNISIDKINGNEKLPQSLAANEFFKITKNISRTLQEYAEDPEKVREIKKILEKSKKKNVEGELIKNNEDAIFTDRPSDFNKSFRSPGETIYSVGVNFIVDQIESVDTIETTNNFKQVGLTAEMDKFIVGKKGEKISADFMYAFPVDYDKQFEIPGSVRASAKYHKAFNDFLLGVFGLDYERQFFVNLAARGTSLQAWSNTLIWYSVGLDFTFEMLERNVSLSAYFSKPFVGNTNYGGEDKRTIDGTRIYGNIEAQLFRNISVRSEIFLSEMTGQGFSNLKNSHVTSATYLIYAF